MVCSENREETYQKKSGLRMQQSFSSTGSSASMGEACGCRAGRGGGDGGARSRDSSRSSSKGVSAEWGRSERRGKRETCSSWSENSPDGELPSAFAAAVTVEARRDLPARGRGVFVFIIGGERARAIRLLDSKAAAAAKEEGRRHAAGEGAGGERQR